MTKEALALPEGMTYTSGYFNGNRWPVQLVISRFNITYPLAPGKFVEDVNGRRINDPYFEAYVKGGQLSREISDEPVPLITVAVASSQLAQRIHDGQSVRSVTEFTTDAKGVKQPVIPLPIASSEQSINKPAFQGMTMDEAKRLGLIKKVREVPEDYGIPDNSSATPPRLPPPLQFAVDTDQPAKPMELPAQLAKAMPKNDVPVRRQIQQQLEQSQAEVRVLDTETGFLNAARMSLTGSAQPEMASTEATNLDPVQDDTMPAPSLEEALPAPPEEDMPIPPLQVRPVRVPARVSKFVCIDCKAEFKMRPELVGHAKKLHPDKVPTILAPYPG